MSVQPPTPPMGPETTQFARLDPGPSRTFGWLSFIVSLVGAVLVVVAFTAVDWFHGGPSSSFRSLHNLLDAAARAHVATEGVAKAYFAWLGWVLFAAAVLCALLAATPLAGGVFRVIGLVVALAGVAVTFLAVQLFQNSGPQSPYNDYASYLKNARFGFYAAAAGFLLTAVGAFIGPGRESRRV